MNRLAQTLLVIAVALFLAAPTLAAKHVTPGQADATVTLNQSDPHFGDFVDFDVVSNVAPTYIWVACSQNGTTSYGGGLTHNDLTYTSEQVGLYAPNWTSGGATCVVDVIWLTLHQNRTIGETGFVVAP